MRSSWYFGENLDARYHKFLYYDRREIDNPDSHDPLRLCYLDRIRRVIATIKRRVPSSKDVKIADFGCSQGNISLTLAELGYKVYAVDIRSACIEYARLKHEKGEIKWIVNNIDDLSFPVDFFDVVVLTEVIEHCAYPEEIVEKVANHVRPGGLLIITTPNGTRIRTALPTFGQVGGKEKRKVFEQIQFRPEGEGHLFLFRLEDIKYIIPKNIRIVEQGYCGSTILINRYSYPFLKLFPILLIEWVIGMLAEIPIINKFTFHNFYVVLEKGYARD